MRLEKVWCRFEKRKPDGTVLKLRIQDLPKDRMNDAVDIMLMFARDEAINKAVGVLDSFNNIEDYKKYLFLSLSDPTCQICICCSDETEEIKDIFGVSIMSLIKKNFSWSGRHKMAKDHGTQELQELIAIFHELSKIYDPIKNFDLDTFYSDRAVFVVPDYRGLSIAKHFFKTRRMICKTYEVPMTGAWMTSIGTQKAAARDGWETVCEIKSDDLAKKHGITFTDVAPNFKYMIAKAGT